MTKRVDTLADLTPDARNANRGTERGRQMLESSLRKYGAGRSVLADKHGALIAGNKTVEVAADLGIPIRTIETDGRELVVVQRTDLDLAEGGAARELAYADNRVGQVSLEWELAQIGADVEAGVDLSALWSEDELAALLAGASGPAEGLTDPDAVPPVPDEPITRPGDLWTLGRHRLLCGDCTDPLTVDRLIGGARVAMVYTDPPYGVDVVQGGHIGGTNLAQVGTYAPVVGDDSTETAIDAYRLCAALGIPALIFWGGNHYASALPDSRCWLVWDKREGMSSNAFADCELAWTNLDRPARLFAHRWVGMLRASERDQKRVHPTQKPVALAEWAFSEFGDSGDSVLDLFGGSGSTLIAAEQTGRAAYLCEISPAYCDVIVARWEQFTGGQAVRRV